MKSTVCCVLGIMCYAHAIFLMYQRAGNQNMDIADEESTTTSAVSLTYLLAVAECVAGFVLAITSFILVNQFVPCKLINKFAGWRYDAALQPEIGFIHFQHRGILGNRKKSMSLKDVSKKDISFHLD